MWFNNVKTKIIPPEKLAAVSVQFVRQRHVSAKECKYLWAYMKKKKKLGK